MKKRIIVSSCLLGICCRYDGNHNRNNDLLDYLKDKIFFPVCPEQLGGLPTPRIPAEKQSSGKIITSKGKDVTDNFILGANESFKLFNLLSCETAILKSRSPSCGRGEIYDGSFSKTLKKGNGVFAQILIDNNIKIFTEKDFMDNVPG